MRHLTLTGTFVLAAIADIASATNFPCINYISISVHIDGEELYLQSLHISYLIKDDFLTSGSSIRLTPKHPCPATLGLGHPQLLLKEIVTVRDQ